MRDRSGFDAHGQGESDRGDLTFASGRPARLHRRGPRLRQRRHRQPAGADAAGLAAGAGQRHAEPRRRGVQGRRRVQRRRRRPHGQLHGRGRRSVGAQVRLPGVLGRPPGRHGRSGRRCAGAYDLAGDVTFSTTRELRQLRLRQRRGERGRAGASRRSRRRRRSASPARRRLAPPAPAAPARRPRRRRRRQACKARGARRAGRCARSGSPARRSGPRADASRSASRRARGCAWT